MITLSGITGLSLQSLSSAVGRICAPVSLIIPAYLIIATEGLVALRGVWPAALVTGATFAGVQFLSSHYIGPQLTDILASISAIASLLVLLRFWRPALVDRNTGRSGWRRGQHIVGFWRRAAPIPEFGRGTQETVTAAGVYPPRTLHSMAALWTPGRICIGVGIQAGASDLEFRQHLFPLAVAA